MHRKTIVFFHGGELYIISTAKKTMGHVIQRGEFKFSIPHSSWKILGVSFHHLRSGIDLKIEDIKNPEHLVGGIVWDVDHGTTRRWGGSYHGRFPRITGAY